MDYVARMKAAMNTLEWVIVIELAVLIVIGSVGVTLLFVSVIHK